MLPASTTATNTNELNHLTSISHSNGRSAIINPRSWQACPRVAPSSLISAVAALRFLYRVTLQKRWARPPMRKSTQRPAPAQKPAASASSTRERTTSASTTSSRRPPPDRLPKSAGGFDEVMSVLQRGDRLVVSELSRLRRSLGQIVAILDALAKADVALASRFDYVRSLGVIRGW